MTTKGLARHGAQRQGLITLMRELRRREAEGQPLIVECEPPLPEHAQRLYATLGVLVRFVRGDE